MNNAQNRKLIAAVLGLAVTALVVDKVVLGGGATPSLAADGSLTPAPSALGSAAEGKNTSGGSGSINESVTAQLVAMGKRLDLDTGPQLVDAFAPPRALSEVLEAETARQKLEERQSKATELASKLREQLRLTATATTSKRGAMINGALIALGSEVPGTGFRVKEVDREGVLLEDIATHATARLELNPNSPSVGYRPGKSD